MPRHNGTTNEVAFEPFCYMGFVIKQNLKGTITVMTKDNVVLYQENCKLSGDPSRSKKYAMSIVDDITKGVQYNAMQCEGETEI